MSTPAEQFTESWRRFMAWCPRPVGNSDSSVIHELLGRRADGGTPGTEELLEAVESQPGADRRTVTEYFRRENEWNRP
ncbi:MAG: hypothetical protein GC200_05080 [Tepidisphaera sp.]|nr:hypothetical protein [Tepidisphaera sp.]